MSARNAAVLFLCGVSTAPCAVCTATPQITIHLWNKGVTDAVLQTAEKKAARLLTSLCVEAVWAHCPSPNGSDAGSCALSSAVIEMHILASRVAKSASEDAMGIALLNGNTGNHTAVFLSRVLELADRESDIITVSDLLGHVIAHEIGHILLHSGLHSREGVMRARFGRQELVKAAQGQLDFTPQQKDAMQRYAAFSDLR